MKNKKDKSNMYILLLVIFISLILILPVIGLAYGLWFHNKLIFWTSTITLIIYAEIYHKTGNYYDNI